MELKIHEFKSSCFRYLVVMKPLRRHLKKKTVLVALMVVGVSSFILCLPPLIYATTRTFPYKNTTVTSCFMEWPDGTPGISVLDSL